MKIVCVVLVVMLGCLAWGQDAPQKQKTSTSARGDQADVTQQVVPPSSPVVDPPAPSLQGQPVAASQQQPSEPESAQRWFLRPEWVIVWVTVIYTILTGFTLRAIKRQADLMEEQARDARNSTVTSALTTQSTLDAIQRQAKSMEDQVSLMKVQSDIQIAGMQQWLDVVPRRANYAPPTMDQDAVEINLQFEALNNTPYVMTLEKIVTHVSYLDDEISTIEDRVLLAPIRNGKTSGYSFYAPVSVVGGSQWRDRGALVTVSGHVFFKDCMGRDREQYFGGIYRCNRGGEFALLGPMGIEPDRERRSSE